MARRKKDTIVKTEGNIEQEVSFKTGKKMKMSDLKKETDIYNEFVVLSPEYDGETFDIKIYPFFSPTKIKDMIQEYSEFINSLKEAKIKIDIESEHGDILAYFIIRNFTDIETTKSKSANTIYKEYKMSLDSKLIKEIIRMIPENSMNSIYEYVQEINDALDKINSMNTDLPLEKLENKELIQEIFSKKVVS